MQQIKTKEIVPIQNVFCPTGSGGGVDPTCSPGGHEPQPGHHFVDPNPEAFGKKFEHEVRELPEREYVHGDIPADIAQAKHGEHLHGGLGHIGHELEEGIAEVGTADELREIASEFTHEEFHEFGTEMTMGEHQSLNEVRAMGESSETGAHFGHFMEMAGAVVVAAYMAEIVSHASEGMKSSSHPMVASIGRTIDYIHKGLDKAGDWVAGKMKERYGDATAGAILGGGDWVATWARNSIGVGAFGKPLFPRSQAILGSILPAIVAEIGYHTGHVGKDTKIEKGLAYLTSKVRDFRSSSNWAIGEAGKVGLGLSYIAGKVAGSVVRATKKKAQPLLASNAVVNKEANDYLVKLMVEAWDRVMSQIPESDLNDLLAYLDKAIDIGKEMAAQGPTQNYREDQARDDHGRFSTEASEASSLSHKIWRQGGFTYRASKRVSPKSGFIVSLPREKGMERPISEADFKKHGRKIVKDYIKEVREMIRNGDLPKRAAVGAWHDKKTGRVVLDVNEVYSSKKEAVNVGKAREQDAIFDLGSHTELDLRQGTHNTRDHRGYIRQGIGRDRGYDRRRNDGQYWRPIQHIDPPSFREMVDNIYCATGAGGGIDPSCGREETHPGVGGATPSCPSPCLHPSDNQIANGKVARVGVPPMSVPPPPPIPRLPNLPDKARAAEGIFVKKYEDNPEQMINDYQALVHKDAAETGDPPTYNTDDFKKLSQHWLLPKDMQAEQAENRATLNLALHQTANAGAKASFLKELDSLKPGDRIMVTCGGCAAGKGFGLGKDDDGNPRVPAAYAVKMGAKAVWDSAGDQNATENKWIQSEAEKRGLKVDYVYTHADPENSWANPKRGCVERAKNPKDGRMVDARVFADSYAYGAKNFDKFAKENANNKSATFTYIDSTSGTPTKVDKMPSNALKVNADHLYSFCLNVIHDKSRDIPKRVKDGATQGTEIWG